MLLPIDVKADGKNLQITTHIDIPYVDWGLKNPSNFFCMSATRSQSTSKPRAACNPQTT